MRYFSEIAECMKQLDRKLLGIVLQHRKVSEQEELIFSYYTKRNHADSYEAEQLMPEYPKKRVPDLVELLDREKYPEHDASRFELLKWVLDVSAENLNLIVVEPKYFEYFLPILTLYFMVKKNFITTTDADIILLSIKHIIENSIPEYVRPPIVDPRAFRIAFLYLKLFQDCLRCIEICGLRNLSVSS